MQGFKKTVAVNVNQILFCTDPQVSVGVIVDDADVSAGDDGRKVVKAGTPLYGDLLDRSTPFTIEAPTVEVGADTPDPVGVLLHDVDVTDGDENGTLLIFGFVNINRLDEATATAIQAVNLRGVTVLEG